MPSQGEKHTLFQTKMVEMRVAKRFCVMRDCPKISSVMRD